MHSFSRSRKLITLFILIPVALFYVIWLSWYPATNSLASSKATIVNEVFEPTDSANSPMGVARGIFPGRVVWVHDTTAAKWNGSSGYWWNDQFTDQAAVSDMLSQSILQITGKDNDIAAWDTLFRFFNYNHGKGAVGYQAGEKIVIKLSLVQSSNPSGNGGNSNFSPPQTVLALLRQLVYNAGVNAGDITFYDIMRAIPASVSDRCKAEFPGVHFVGSQTGHNQEKYNRDTTIIHWSEDLNMELKGGHTAYLPTIITKATYMINFAQFKGHRYVGVTGCAKNHFGSMSADGDVNTPHSVGLHPYVTVHGFYINGSAEWSFKQRPMGTYNALVDLMGHRDLGEKTLLFMVDGLYGVPQEGSAVTSTCKWIQPPFNNNWTSSIFMSLDDVALESVLVDLYRTEQAINPNLVQDPFYIDSTFAIQSTYIVFGNVDNILHEASQANNPPSGAYYAPNGDGVRLPSLGVHEHWNNPTDKQYTRNLGIGNGIELDAIAPSIPAPSDLTSVRDNDTFASLTWSNNGDNSGNIIVYRSMTVNTDFKPVVSLTGDIDTYVDAGTLSDKVYFYRLKRVTSSAYSVFSNESKLDAVAGVGIDVSVTANKFDVYPNPASSFVNVQLNDPYLGNTELVIIDMKGRVIKNNNIQKKLPVFQYTMDVSDMQKGLYYVRIYVGGDTYTKAISIR